MRIRQRQISFRGKKLFGLEFRLGKANLVLVIAARGYVACGYLNLKTAKKLGDSACIVTGVSTINDLLNAKIKALSPLAKKSGIKIGMPAKTALEKLL